MRNARISWLAVAVAVLAVGGCGGTAPAAGAAPVPRASPTWSEPSEYTFVLTTGCTRGFYEARYRVVVRDGQTVSATGMNPMAWDHADYQAPTMGELHTWITASEPGDSRIRRDRDPVDGHPVVFGFDPEAMAADGGECYAVSEYEPR